MPTVVSAKFEDLVAVGLNVLISEDPNPTWWPPGCRWRGSGARSATACLSKETEARDIINAIHLASRGMHMLPRSAAAGGASTLDIIGSELLTRREAEVLELLHDGATNAQIAYRLSIGVETVRTHARNIYRKLGIASRRDLPRLARQEPVVVDAERRPLND